MYLLPSSCHPTHTTRNIPYSLCYRLVRICSNRTTLLSRLEELSKLLLSSNYDKTVIKNAINRSLQLSRTECLKKVARNPSNRVVYVTTYHPVLPSYSKILNRAWKVMVKDPYLKDVCIQKPSYGCLQATQKLITADPSCKNKTPNGNRVQENPSRNEKM